MKSVISSVLAFFMFLVSLFTGASLPGKTASVSFAKEDACAAWTGFVLAGDAVELDAGKDNGSQTEFVLKAVQPGQALIRFTCILSSGMEPAEEKLILAYVDEDLTITTMDVTDGSAHIGEVLTIEGCEVTMMTGTHGEVIAVFPEEMALPAVGEQICVYTDGTMTMSLPGMVNVLAWETVPSELARETR